MILLVMSLFGFLMTSVIIWWFLFFLSSALFLLSMVFSGPYNMGMQLFFLTEELLSIFFVMGSKAIIMLALLLKVGSGFLMYWLYSFLSSLNGSGFVWFLLVKKLVLWSPLSVCLPQGWLFLLLGVFFTQILSLLSSSLESFLLFNSGEGGGLLLVLLSLEQLGFFKVLIFYLLGVGISLSSLVSNLIEFETLFLFVVLPVSVIWWVKLSVLLSVKSSLVMVFLALSFFSVALGASLLFMEISYQAKSSEFSSLVFFLSSSLIFFLL